MAWCAALLLVHNFMVLTTGEKATLLSCPNRAALRFAYLSITSSSVMWPDDKGSWVVTVSALMGGSDWASAEIDAVRTVCRNHDSRLRNSRMTTSTTTNRSCDLAVEGDGGLWRLPLSSSSKLGLATGLFPVMLAKLLSGEGVNFGIISSDISIEGGGASSVCSAFLNVSSTSCVAEVGNQSAEHCTPSRKVILLLVFRDNHTKNPNKGWYLT